MTATPAAESLLALFRQAGAVPYDVLDGNATTTKLARLRLANGNPIAIQINNKTSRIWMLPEHERGALAELGKHHSYGEGKGRHHHLQQVREFRSRPLLKVEVLETGPSVLRTAIAAVSK